MKVAGGSGADDHCVDPAFHLLENFHRGGLIVVVGIGGIVELVGHEGVRITSYQILGAPDRTQHAFGVRSPSHLGAQSSHDLDFFFGETFGNEKRDLVTALDADESEADAGIAGSGFDDRATRLEASVFFGAQDDSTGGAILHTATRVQIFQLGEDAGRVARNQFLQLKNGSFADQLGDVISNAQARALDGLCPHTTGYGSGGGASIVD